MTLITWQGVFEWLSKRATTEPLQKVS